MLLKRQVKVFHAPDGNHIYQCIQKAWSKGDEPLHVLSLTEIRKAIKLALKA